MAARNVAIILPSLLSQRRSVRCTQSLSGGGPAFHNSINVDKVMPLKGAGCKSSRWCVVCQSEPKFKGRWSLKTHLRTVHNLDMLPSCSVCTVPYVREQWDDITKHYVSEHGGKDEASVLWLLVPCKRPGESYLDINFTPLCYVPMALEGEECNVDEVVEMGKKRERPWLESRPSTSTSSPKSKGKGKGKSTRCSGRVTPPRTVVVEEEVSGAHSPRPTVGHKTTRRRKSVSPQKVVAESVLEEFTDDSELSQMYDDDESVFEANVLARRDLRVRLSRVAQPGPSQSPNQSTSGDQGSLGEDLSAEQINACQQTAQELECSPSDVKTWLQVSLRMRSHSPRGLSRELQRHGVCQVREQGSDTETKVETFHRLLPR